MSTYAHSLYRPIKLKDIFDLGFEMYEGEGEDYYEGRIRISPDKLGIHVVWEKIWQETMGFPKYRNEEEYYYLFLDILFIHKEEKCVYSFTRYGDNSPALDYMLQGLSDKGYKLKVEGKRYNNEEYFNKLKYVIKHLGLTHENVVVEDNEKMTLILKDSLSS